MVVLGAIRPHFSQGEMFGQSYRVEFQGGKVGAVVFRWRERLETAKGHVFECTEKGKTRYEVVFLRPHGKGLSRPVPAYPLGARVRT